MKKILGILKRVWILSFFRRLYVASRYFNKKYLQIVKWGFRSREYTNFTYHLSEDNLGYLAHTIAVVTKLGYDQVMSYMEELQSDKELQDTILSALEKSPERRYADKEIRFGRRLG